MKRVCALIVVPFALLILLGTEAGAMERFPPPDFESGYVLPEGNPTPRPDVAFEITDLFVVLALMGVTTYLTHVRRWRQAVSIVATVCVVYLGFWRQGCICPIGATQNVALALFDPTYAAPLSVVALFALPLLFSLGFGRTYCAGACPLGAIQDLVLVKPVRVPRAVDHTLGLLPYGYLGLAVALAATGSAFLICRFDPFVGLFRLSGSLGMLVFGILMVATSAFVGRPYCRFMCPYGALLRVTSRVSKWHVSITPDECIQCRLCEDSCPFGAINKPNADQPARPRTDGLKRLALLMLLVPVLVVAGTFVGYGLGGPLSHLDITVKTAERVRLEEAGLVEGTTDESDAFRRTARPSAELYAEATATRASVRTGAAIWGAFFGLVIAIKLISLSVRRTRTDYEPDKMKCVSCARCFESCPREHKRIKEPTETQH
jgi:ferredoxin